MQRELPVKPGQTVKDGVMTGSMTGDRLVILPSRFWTEAKRFLENAYGSSVNLVLNRFAQEIGMSYGNFVKTKGLGVGEAFEVMSEMAMVSGWGKVKVTGSTGGGDEIMVEITSCAFCPIGEAGKGGKCDFIAGVAEGVAKAIHGCEYVCSAHVDESEPSLRKCRLLISRADKEEKDWQRAVYFPWMNEKPRPT